MAFWFHRNSLKETSEEKYDYKIFYHVEVTRQLCKDMGQSRCYLLDLLKNENTTNEKVEPAFHNYLSLMYGLIWEIKSPEDEVQYVGRPKASELRYLFSFTWSHSLLGMVTFSINDLIYEVANMSMNVGLWYMKHAAMIAAKDDITMDEAKCIHSTLRRAAGIFSFVLIELMPQSSFAPPEGTDLDPRVINAYINQCIAEAQEVTMARAIELKQNASLISALANETSKLFLDASLTLRQIKRKVATQWIKYLELKSAFYKSYAYNYYGENLLSLDKCGEAIRALRESEAFLKKAKWLCVEYNETRGPAPYTKPDKHAVFKRLASTVKLTLNKCNRENGLIYHHKIPKRIPPLDAKATFGLVSPINFQMPAANPAWTLDTYNIMSGKTPVHVDMEQISSSAEEEDCFWSSKEPKNESGCCVQ